MKNSKINVIIVDDNKEFRSILNDFLSNESDIIVTGIGNDGIEALELIQEQKPDLIILDIIMPRLDGIGVLQKLKTMNLNPVPKVIILSTAWQDEITQKALSLGAEYYVVKPFDMTLLCKRILQMFNYSTSTHLNIENTKPIQISESKSDITNELDLKQKITDIIYEVGIPTHVKGYKFIREALELIINDIEISSSINDALYPLIAEKYNTTPSRVERAIQHAIKIAWSKEQVDIIDKLFGFTSGNNKYMPTNGEFITTLVDKLKIKIKTS